MKKFDNVDNNNMNWDLKEIKVRFNELIDEITKLKEVLNGGDDGLDESKEDAKKMGRGKR